MRLAPPSSPGTRSSACREIGCSRGLRAAQHRRSSNLVWGSVLYLHLTEGLGFSEQDFGNVTSAFFAGSLIGSRHGIYCRSVRLSTLLHLSIMAAIISNAVSFRQLDSLTSAYIVSVIAGAAYMTGTLIQLDLTARIIPARAAATVFEPSWRSRILRDLRLKHSADGYSRP